MLTPSKSRSSTMGSKGYFNRRESMERSQLKSERQMQALLCKTRRLKEENEVLRIQLSSSGPPRSQQPRSQQTNSRQNEEATYPGNAEFLSNEQEIQPKERSPPTCHASQDESSESTHISAKKRHDRKSQLSDAMRARLGPQMLNMGGNHM